MQVEVKSADDDDIESAYDPIPESSIFNQSKKLIIRILFCLCNAL